MTEQSETIVRGHVPHEQSTSTGLRRSQMQTRLSLWTTHVATGLPTGSAMTFLLQMYSEQLLCTGGALCYGLQCKTSHSPPKGGTEIAEQTQVVMANLGGGRWQTERQEAWQSVSR